MKLFTLFMILFAIELWGNGSAVMLTIESGKEKLPDGAAALIRGEIGSVLTGNGFTLVDREAQMLVMKTQSMQHKTGLYSEKSLIKTGRLVAAKGVLIVTVTPKEGANQIQLSYIDLKSGAVEGVVHLNYPQQLNQILKLRPVIRGGMVQLLPRMKREPRRGISLKVTLPGGDRTRLKQFRDLITEELTGRGERLIDDTVQQRALLERKKQIDSGFYDEETLVKSGRLGGAKGMVVISITPFDKGFGVRGKYLDLEQGTASKTAIMTHPGTIGQGMKPLLSGLIEGLLMKQQRYTITDQVPLLLITPKKGGLSDREHYLLRGGIESVLTERGYRLIDPEGQKLGLRKQMKQQSSGNYDQKELLKAGRMSAASGIVQIQVVAAGDGHLFTISYIDLKSGVVLKTASKNMVQRPGEMGAFLKGVTELGEMLFDQGCIESRGCFLQGETAKNSELLGRSCDLGMARGCLAAGKLGKKEVQLNYYRKGCTLGAGVGCRLYGAAILMGDHRKGVEVLQRGCDLKDGESCYLLGRYHRRNRDIAPQKTFFQRGCDLQSGGACTALGTLLAGDKKGDKGVILIRYRKGCLLGDSEGCNRYGRYLLQFEGISKSVLNALERGCQLNHPVACYSGGLLYKNGPKRVRNLMKGRALFEKSCKLGHKKGCNHNITCSGGSCVVANCQKDRCVVAKNSFMMGDQSNRQHRVTLDGYRIDRYEITVEQYQRCVAAGGCKLQSINPYRDNRYGRGCNYGAPGRGKQPLNCINWSGAQYYCRWAGGELPSEAQWELAARWIDGRRYPWGSEQPTCDRAVLRDQKGAGCGTGGVSITGSRSGGHSPYGVYDLSGNVAEWCRDFYDPNYYNESPERNPVGPEKGEFRVVRGGSWLDRGDILSSTNRAHFPETFQGDRVGFRCVYPLKDPDKDIDPVKKK